jgi:2-amino-4-hydroxy-6-hydroxymethyldihydropteridine diphosphokinase
VTEAFIGLGSNVGDRREHLRAAYAGLERLGRVARVSSLYETEPVGFAEQGAFLNAVAVIETELTPHDLLQELLKIEAGRERVRAQRNGPRTLDLDLLFYGDEVIDRPGLAVPHPRLQDRRFVLAPLCQIAPDLRHPALGLSVQELLEELRDAAGVLEAEPYPAWIQPPPYRT